MFRGKSLTIACTDLKKSAHFYETVLGAVLEPRDGYGCRWYDLGAMSINLMPNSTEPTPARFPEHPMLILWLETDDLTIAERRFFECGVTILQPSDGQFMMIEDPDGIIIEVWKSETRNNMAK